MSMINDEIGRQVIEYEGKIVFVTIEQDQDVPNPLEDWDGMGKILSLGRRHINYAPEEIERLVKEQPNDIVRLSYFEHGQCAWGLQGFMDNYPDFRWDGVRFAGIWIPDSDTLKEADRMGDKRRWFLETRAHEACEVYNHWLNGDVYYISVQAYDPIKDKNGNVVKDHCVYSRLEVPFFDDSCGGFFGWTDMRGEIGRFETALIEAVRNHDRV